MPGALSVSLERTHVGTLTNLPGDCNIFAFAPEYLEDPDRPVLSQSFLDESGEVIRAVPRTHTASPPFFANLLPEEESPLRSIVARQRRLRKAPDFPFLRVLGRDLPGAVIIDDTDGIEDRVFEGDDATVESGSVVRFSLAGMQLKFSASMLNDRFFLTHRGEDDTWIVKMPTNTYARRPENEFSVMTLAAATGLNVPPIELRALDSFAGFPSDLPALRPDEPRLIYAIQRFDRLAGGRRMHVEDFNQVVAQNPSDKYENKTSSSVASIVSRICEPADLDEFVRRLVFGICVGNDDMHLKNWALAYPDGRRASLAPMYDFVCSRPYFPAGTLALTVGGERDFSRISMDAMRAFARRAEISSKRVEVLVREVVERIRSAWPDVKVRIEDRELVTALERHFAHVPIMNAT